jgi:hypothetical protein
LDVVVDVDELDEEDEEDQAEVQSLTRALARACDTSYNRTIHTSTPVLLSENSPSPCDEKEAETIPVKW